MECMFMKGCPMFKLFKMDATKKTFMNTYCMGNFEKCVRYNKRRAGEVVPDNLLPNGEYLKKMA